MLHECFHVFNVGFLYFLMLLFNNVRDHSDIYVLCFILFGLMILDTLRLSSVQFCVSFKVFFFFSFFFFLLSVLSFSL